MSRTLTGRRALSIALTTALAGTALFTLQGTSNAAPGAAAAASPVEGSVAAGSVVSITGTAFKDAAGVLNVKSVGAGVPRVVTGSIALCSDATTGAAGGAAAFTFSVLSATKITAKLPAHAAGAVKLCLPTVTSAGAHVNAYVAVPYTYAAQPTVGTLSHATGPSYGGQTVVATSTIPWRTGSTVVTVGGVVATGVKVATGGVSLSFVTPQSSGTALDVVVKTPGFANTTFTGGYGYESAIKVTPAVVDPAGDSITITGSGFAALVHPGVWFVEAGVAPGSEPTCSNVSVVSDTELTCDVTHTRGVATAVVGDVTDGTAPNNYEDGTLAAATGASVVTSGSTVTFATY